MKQQIYSFDVFDTVLCRVTATPEGVFSLIRHTILHGKCCDEIPGILARDFIGIRINAEKTARASSDKEDITLRDIYSVIAGTFSLTEKSITLLMEIEIKHEVESVFGIPVMIARIRDARESGHQILFISDSYLPQVVIQEMLIHAGAFREGDALFQGSGLIKKSKQQNSNILEKTLLWLNPFKSYKIYSKFRDCSMV